MNSLDFLLASWETSVLELNLGEVGDGCVLYPRYSLKAVGPGDSKQSINSNKNMPMKSGSSVGNSSPSHDPEPL